jgi:hypothetical protein
MLVAYKLGESQLDSVTALKHFNFRQICERYSMLDNCRVMDLATGPDLASTITEYNRIDKPRSEFRDLGKRCLEQLKQQLDIRFGYGNPNKLVPIFLDPVTCPMAKVLIPADRYKEASRTFKVSHLLTYIELIMGKETLRACKIEGNNYRTMYNDDKEEAKVCIDEVDPMLLFDQELNDSLTEDGNNKDEEFVANDIVQQWISQTTTIDWKLHVINNKSSSAVRISIGKICYADIFARFCDVGVHKFESIALMARLYLQKMNNYGFKKSVVSSANGPMTKNQGNMSFDVLEKQTLLYHNKNFMLHEY